MVKNQVLSDPKFNILIVEDSSYDLEHITTGFVKFNIKNTLYVAYNGQEAINMLLGKGCMAIPKPDIILSDICMPQMSGLEFVQILRNDLNFSSIPVIIISSSQSLHDIETAKRLKVMGHFVKPLDFSEFLPIYEDILSKNTNI